MREGMVAPAPTTPITHLSSGDRIIRSNGTNTVLIQNNPNIPQKTYSFGTVLRTTDPKVDAVAKQFRTIRKPTATQAKALPASFDGRVSWKGLLCPVLDQGSCGDCWAHASSTALADRFAILSLGQIQFKPSPSELAICSHKYDAGKIASEWENVSYYQSVDKDLHANRACNGASLYDALGSLYTDGITDSECFPAKNNGISPTGSNGNSSGNGGVVNPNGSGGSSTSYVDLVGNVSTVPSYDVPQTEDGTSFPYCYQLQGEQFDTCLDGKTAMRKYRAKTCYNVSADIDSIKHDLVKYGPVLCGLMVFEDFLTTYDGKSVYAPTTGATAAGGHAVCIQGYGHDSASNMDYWLIKNSWSSSWGDNGYFKIQQGNTMCQLEQNVVGMIPDFPGMPVSDPNIVPVETPDEATIQQFTDHFIDPNTGYYNTAIPKIQAGTLTVINPQTGQSSNVVTPYLLPGASLPDYTTFYAMDALSTAASIAAGTSPASPVTVLPASLGGTGSASNTSNNTYAPSSSTYTSSGRSWEEDIGIALGVVGSVLILGVMAWKVYQYRRDHKTIPAPLISAPAVPTSTVQSTIPLPLPVPSLPTSTVQPSLPTSTVQPSLALPVPSTSSLDTLF